MITFFPLSLSLSQAFALKVVRQSDKEVLFQMDSSDRVVFEDQYLEVRYLLFHLVLDWIQLDCAALLFVKH